MSFFFLQALATETLLCTLTIPTQDKRRTVIQRPQCPKQTLLDNLGGWLKVSGTHFFVRPLLGSLVLVDCDSCNVPLDKLLALKPRALVKTSGPNNYQLWLTLPQSLRSHCALTICRELTAALQADPNSAKTGQQGRLPGSMNVKPGKDQPVELLHAETQDMDEHMYLSLTPAHLLCVRGQTLQPVCRPPKLRPAKEDLSSRDWSMCCAFFEARPQATLEDAKVALHDRFHAVRPNQSYYQNLTLQKAFRHVRGQSSIPAEASRVAAPASAAEPSLASIPAEASKVPAPASAAAPNLASASEKEASPARAPLSEADVKRIIQDTLQKRFPAKEVTAKTCKECQRMKDRKMFSATAWAAKDYFP